MQTLTTTMKSKNSLKQHRKMKKHPHLQKNSTGSWVDIFRVFKINLILLNLTLKKSYMLCNRAV